MGCHDAGHNAVFSKRVGVDARVFRTCDRHATLRLAFNAPVARSVVSDGWSAVAYAI